MSSDDETLPSRATITDGNVGGFRWDSYEAVRYEVAREALNAAVGSCVAAIQRAEAGDMTINRDAAWEHLRHARAVEDALDPTDRRAVDETIYRFYKLARDLAPAQ